MLQLRKVTYILLFVMLASLLVRDVINYDIWWHLKLGDLILQSHSIPRHELFSYPLAGTEWLDIHWLYQILLTVIFKFSGFAGLILLKTAIYIMTFFLLTRINSKHVFSLGTAVGFVLGANAAYERLVVRPEMVSALFLTIFILLLSRFKEGEDRHVWLLPLIQIFWTNIQGLFVLGPLTVSLFVLGEFLAPLRKRLFPGVTERQLSRQARRKSGIVLLLVCLACFVNPYFYKAVLYPLDFFRFFSTSGTPGFSTTVTEFISPFKQLYYNEPFYWYLALLALSSVLLIVKLSIFPIWQLLTVTFFLILSVLSRRNILFFAISVFPLLTKALSNLLENSPTDTLQISRKYIYI